MASLGKKILSAFVEVGKEENGVKSSQNANSAVRDEADGRNEGAVRGGGGVREGNGVRDERAAPTDDRFADYFDKLFSEANIPGPDYYEFARMIDAMQMIPDEPSRYHAAYAGLQVQGLSKDKLLDTAAEYLRVLTTDADHFQKTLDAALQEKVHSKAAEAEEKAQRIQALSQEIMQLQQQIGALQDEVRVNRDKLTGGGNSYTAESKRRQEEIRRDIEKINQYIH